MTKKEIKKCKDYYYAKKVIRWWYKEDESFELPFDDRYGRTYYWRAGLVRQRMVKRFPWEDYKTILDNQLK